MEYNYYIIFKQHKNGIESELSFNVGGKDKPSRLLRLRGRKTSKIFNGMLRTLSRTGCITPIETGGQSV